MNHMQSPLLCYKFQHYTFTKLNGDKVIIIEKMVQTYVLLSHIKKTLSLPSRFGNFGYIYVICG